MDVTCKLTAGFLAGFLRFHVTYYNWQNDLFSCIRLSHGFYMKFLDKQSKFQYLILEFTVGRDR